MVKERKRQEEIMGTNSSQTLLIKILTKLIINISIKKKTYSTNLEIKLVPVTTIEFDVKFL